MKYRILRLSEIETWNGVETAPKSTNQANPKYIFEFRSAAQHSNRMMRNKHPEPKHR